MVNICEKCNLHEGHEVHNGESFPLLAAHSFKLLKLVTEPTEKQIMELARKLGIRTWDQGNDGFGGEWGISEEQRVAIKAFWLDAYNMRHPHAVCPVCNGTKEVIIREGKDGPVIGQVPCPDKHATGLYNKFTVTRNDGKSDKGEKHDGCEYFVLDLDHDIHAPAAIRAYATSCASDYPVLARDLIEKVGSGPSLPSEGTRATRQLTSFERGLMPLAAPSDTEREQPPTKEKL